LFSDIALNIVLEVVVELKVAIVVVKEEALHVGVELLVALPWQCIGNTVMVTE
jgi:hypothetical protein